MGIIVRAIATVIAAWFTWVIHEVPWASIGGFIMTAIGLILTLTEIAKNLKELGII
ncbi:MAG: hypothetical protein ACKPH7_02685 [Planktothrix sp.]|uniref:hypothetical protein n=1 Tax=Planktothrix sp. TaxID=3088171 RepID=UPI0038D4295A